MSKKETIEERRARVIREIRGEPNDRTPFFLSGNAVFLKYADSNATVADFVNDPVGAAKKFLPSLEKLDKLDALSGVGQWPGVGGSMWLAKTKLPGRDIAPDVLWQIDEKAFMTHDDYDFILDKGWRKWYDGIVRDRLGYTEEEFTYARSVRAQNTALLKEYGYPWMPDVIYQSPVDKLTAGRGVLGFAQDVRKIPDKLLAVIDVMIEEELVLFMPLLENSRSDAIVMITPPIRCNCDYNSEAVFEKFAWPSMSRAADMAVESGRYVFFHMDSNWDDFLHFFTAYKPHTCIYDSDGVTDIYKVKEVLGDRMCITGNISPTLLCLGTPDEVYTFCRKQIEDMGQGYILSGACTLPPNAKPENLDAMNAAIQ